MPGGDRTGPMGMGPMTGRGAGYCAGFAVPGFVNRVFGGGFFGRGRGGGRGWRNMFYATGLPGWARVGMGAAGAALAAGVFRGMTQEQELDVLKQQADQAASVLESVRQRISELEGKTQK
jgi:hypothetical protein